MKKGMAILFVFAIAISTLPNSDSTSASEEFAAKARIPEPWSVQDQFAAKARIPEPWSVNPKV